jgi:PAS domain S-box-containing protein
LRITLIDAGIMTVLIFPLLYLLSFRPLLLYIEKSGQAEQKNRLLSSIVEQTADTVVVTDRDGVIEYVNPAFEQLTGFSRNEALGQTPRVLKSGVHAEKFYKTLWDTILSGEVYQNEIANLKKDGELFYEVKTITPLREATGEITHFVATGKDITERKLAEQQLRSAYDDLELRVQARTEELRIANGELEEEIAERKRVEAMLQEQAEELELQAEELRVQTDELIFANDRLRQSQEDLDRAQQVGQIGSWRLDVQRNVLTWSDENYRIFGVALGTPQTYETFLAVVHPDDRHYVDVQWRAGMDGDPYDIEHRLLVDGQVKWVREKAFLEFNEDGTLKGGFGITQDITERVKAEEAIRASEEKYRSLFDHMSEGFALHEIILDADGNPCDYRFLELNAAFESLTGLSREKSLGRTVKEVIPDIEPFWIETYGKVAVTGEPVHFINYSGPLGKWYEIYCYASTPNQFAVLFFDVTERKLAEARMAYLASFPEQNPNPVMEVDFEGQVRYANPATLRLFPELPEQGPAHAWLADWEASIRQLRAGETERIVRDLAIGDRYFEQSLYPFLASGLVRIYGKDITERKRAEAEIQRAAEEVRAANQELKRFNTLMVGRELRMIELKKEVNELCASTNQLRRYPLEFEKEGA